MLYHAVLFDLDGTLMDTLQDIADSVNSALATLGFPPHAIEDYKHFVGDGTTMLAFRVLPESYRTQEMSNRLLELIREEYAKRWRINTHLFDGIIELLDELARRDIRMAILTNKSQNVTDIMVPELLSAWQFDVIIGAQQSMPRKPDPSAALHIAAAMNILPREFVFLGDSDTDMKTAAAAGMYPAGALWGYRTKDELISAGAKTLIQKPPDLLHLLVD